ncbi:MAG: hypothetical protein R8N50_04175 [Alphaproteobacteria bacterium]|nr:hypothetical protein [Alphaproteobacteria bacterium]
MTKFLFNTQNFTFVYFPDIIRHESDGNWIQGFQTPYDTVRLHRDSIMVHRTVIA